MMSIIFVLLIGVSAKRDCYWNRPCPYRLFGVHTPYETVRGDIRDYPDPKSCQAVSLWSLHKNGNYFGQGGQGADISSEQTLQLITDIITRHSEGHGHLCAQDVDAFRNWASTREKMGLSYLKIMQHTLTEVGRDEAVNIGKRVRLRFPHLLQGSADDYYFRPCRDKVAVDSIVGFLKGLNDADTPKLRHANPFQKNDMLYVRLEMETLLDRRQRVLRA